MIKLEITADSAADFLAQLAAFTASPPSTPYPVTNISPVEDATMPEIITKVTEIKAAPAKKAVVKAEAPKAEAPKAETPKEPAKGNGADDLNFNDHVAPVVVAYLEKHGKPAVLQVLSAFNVERASEVPPGQWPQLIAAINAADVAAAA